MTTVSRRQMSLGLLAVGSTALAGCAPRPKLLSAPFTGRPNTRSILVATNRTMTPDPKVQFIEGRSDELSFLRYDISIPSTRKLGAYSFPKRDLDPEREFFVARTQNFATPQGFVAGVNADIDQAADKSGNVLVFVHGYNSSYAGSVFRAAQISTDFDLDMPVTLFSWPSAARVSRYSYDRDSALFARSGLADTLALLARTQARKITVLAHSMGSFIAVEAIKRLTMAGDAKTLSAISDVVLAQPDIDIDVFRRQMDDIDLKNQSIVVLASQKDRALKLSSVLTGGHPRVGAGDNIESLRKLGVLVLDISDLETRDFLNHDAYAASPALLSMVRSGTLSERIISGAPGQDLLIEGVNLTGSAALAIAYLPYTVSGN